MGRKTEKREKIKREIAQAKSESKTKGKNKMSELYKKDPLGEGKPSSWPGKFKIEGRTRKTKTCRPGLGMLNLYIRCLSWLLVPTMYTYQSYFKRGKHLFILHF